MDISDDEEVIAMICLRWASFEHNVMATIHDLRNDNSEDVTIVTEHEILKAHKFVLIAGSAYFASKLKNPSAIAILLQEDIPNGHLKLILQFMYTGEVSVDQDELIPFLETARLLKVKGLVVETPEEGLVVDTPEEGLVVDIPEPMEED